MDINRDGKDDLQQAQAALDAVRTEAAEQVGRLTSAYRLAAGALGSLGLLVGFCAGLGLGYLLWGT